MKPDKDFLESIKDALMLHLEDEVDLYLENKDLHSDDSSTLVEYYNYAADNLFQN